MPREPRPVVVPQAGGRTPRRRLSRAALVALPFAVWGVGRAPDARVASNGAGARFERRARVEGRLDVAGGIPRATDGFRFARLGSEHGLSHNTVHALAQDRHGFLWFGTRDGLDRYDGYDFVSYRHDPDDPRSLASNWITALLADRSGGLWVGTAAGLHHLGPDRAGFRRVALDEAAGAATGRPVGGAPAGQGSPTQLARPARAVPRLKITAVAEGPDGAIWAGSERGLFRIDPESGRVTALRYDPHDRRSLAHSAVLQASVAPDGAVWVVTPDGTGRGAVLHRLTAAPPVEPVEPAPSGARLAGELPAWSAERYDVPTTIAFVLSKTGDVWYGASHPISWRTPPDSRATRYDGTDERPNATMPTSFAEDARGRIWMGTHTGLFVVDTKSEDGPPIRVPTTASGDRGLTDEVNAFLLDRAGALWIGTFGGVLRLDARPSPFDHLTHRPGDPHSLASNAISSVYRDPAGTIWVGTYGAGIDRIDPETGQARHYRGREPGGPCGDYVWDLAPSSRGALWVAVGDRLCELGSDGRFRAHVMPAGAGAAVTVVEANDGGGSTAAAPSTVVVFLGTSTGLFEYRPATRQARRLIGPDDGLSGVVDVVRVTVGGVVWAASGGSGDLARYEIGPGRATVFPAVGEGIWDIHVDAGGAIWLATNNGLTRFDAEAGVATRFPRRAGGAPFAGGMDRSPQAGSIYYSVLEDEDGRLWMGTSKGLVRGDPGRPDGGIRRFSFGPAGNVEYNRHAAFRAADGRLFFGGMNGVTTFHPREIVEDPYVPPVVLTGIGVLGDAGERFLNPFALDRLVLAPRDRAVDFEFAAVDFTEPHKNRYAYRLRGFDDAWIESGARRFARYTSLPPGDYAFEVRMAGEDGVWREPASPLPLTVLPPFWRTWWFQLAALGGAVALLALAHRLRVRRLIDIERMRLRIAGDLHDELGSDLSAIALLSSMVGRRDYLEPRDRERLGDVAAGSRRVMDGLREVVWYIDPEHDTLGALARRMRPLADRLLPGVDHEFSTNLAASGDAIAMDVRRHLFLACKELLANAAKHARARRVAASFVAEAGRLVLEVADDGAGLPEGWNADGNGLRTVRRRAAQMDATLDIESRPGEGTRIRLSLPAARRRPGVLPRRA